MRLHSLGNEIIFDDFSPNQADQKVFLTTLVHIEKLKLPEVWPTIYTSNALKTQLKIFLESKSITLENDTFHILKPLQPQTIALSDGTTFEVLLCEPQDASTSFMLVFRRGYRITHFYAGFCSNVSGAILNETFAGWLTQSYGSIDALYMIMDEATKRCGDCELKDDFEDIEYRVKNDEQEAKLVLSVPIFGWELFIYQLSLKYKGYVGIVGTLNNVYKSLPKAEMEYFTDDLCEAKIILCDRALQSEPDHSINSYNIKWSPLPFNFELEVLEKLLRPDQTFDIDNKMKFSEGLVPKKIKKHACSTLALTAPNTKPTERIKHSCISSSSLTTHNAFRSIEKDSLLSFYKEDFFQERIEEILNDVQQLRIEIAHRKRQIQLRRSGPFVLIRRLSKGELAAVQTQGGNKEAYSQTIEKSSFENSTGRQQTKNNTVENFSKEKQVLERIDNNNHCKSLPCNNPSTQIAQKLLEKQQATSKSKQVSEVATTAKNFKYQKLQQQKKMNPEEINKAVEKSLQASSSVKEIVFNPRKKGFQYLEDESD